MCTTNTFIALHLGAGYHCTRKESQYKQLCKTACKFGMKLLTEGHDSVSVVQKVCSLLEDSELTNAGYGSNLTVNGTVECDAGIMSSSNGQFAGVGCVRNIKNPIKLAGKILIDNQVERQNHGLIAPILLAGEGAKEKALYYNLNVVEEKTMISKKALTDFEKYKRILSNENEHENKKRKLEEHDESHVQDTIGVICVDVDLNMASGISSGGIVMKQSGRIGHAAHFGSGCWSYKYSDDVSVCCCTSGCGEYLIRTNLAKEVSESCYKSVSEEIFDLNNVIEHLYLRSLYLKEVIHPKLCGVLLLKLSTEATETFTSVNKDEDENCNSKTNKINVSKEDNGGCNSTYVNNECDSHIKKPSNVYLDFYVAHTTESFSVGFMTGAMKQPRTFISRMNKKDLIGEKVLTQAFSFTL